MQLVLAPIPPFSFELSGRIFAGGDPQFRRFQDGEYRHCVLLNGCPVLLRVTSAGTIDEPRLRADVRGASALGGADASAAEALVSRLFHLTMDLMPFYEAVAGDPIMSSICRQLRGMKSPVTATVFEALVDSIVEQQISLVVAHSLEGRLIRSFGRSLVLDGATYYAYPAPPDLATTTVDELRSCGLTLRKAEYIRDAARQVEAGELDLEGLEAMPDTEAIITTLDAVRGIGRWTAELTAIRGLGRPDAFPADDIGLQRILSQYYAGGRRLSADEARGIAARWGEWRGLAAYYLVVAEIMGLEVPLSPA